MKDIKQIRLIDSSGHQLGIFNVKDAINKVKESDLDIVLINKDVEPAICKMLDFGKYKYDEHKKQKAHKAHVQDLKEVKISPRIQEHDIETQVKKVNHFLGEGDKVKITCVFKAREMQHPQIGIDKIKLLLSKVTVEYHVDKEIEVEKNMHTIICPVKK